MAVNSILRAFAPAAKVTLPVGTGYLFLGAAYGIYMHVNGFSVWYPALMAWLIYGGSLEFVAASMLLSPFAPVTTFFVAFMIQARHLFYGLAMLDRFKGLGWKKFYLIFGMSDETFALEFATKAPAGVDSSWYMMWITFLDRMYWLGGAVLGATLGSFLTFDTKGLSFVMTAMFVVIFLEQFLKEKHHWTAWIGFGASLGCLAIFGRCTNGINTGQFEQMIEQIDDHIKLERRWAHNLGHMAGDAGFATVSEKMHAAQAMLDDVRALLDEAKDALEDDAEASANVTVNLV